MGLGSTIPLSRDFSVGEGSSLTAMARLAWALKVGSLSAVFSNDRLLNPPLYLPGRTKYEKLPVARLPVYEWKV